MSATPRVPSNPHRHSDQAFADPSCLSCLSPLYPVTCSLSMADQERSNFAWMDLLWPALLAFLAVLPPIREIHKQLILLGIGIFQIFEGRMLKPVPSYLRRSWVENRYPDCRVRLVSRITTSIRNYAENSDAREQLRTCGLRTDRVRLPADPRSVI